AAAAVAAAAGRLRAAATAAEVVAVLGDRAGAGLGPDQAHQALALHPAPPGPPEDWEHDDGATMVWPPAPDQALTCEPVTAADYAQRARAVEGVRRAWAVPAALPGIAWHGGPTVVTDRPGVVTLLVERSGGTGTDAQFLRRVLDGAVGEVGDPYDLFARTAPRRVLGEEVNAALLRQCPVLLEATLHAAAGADRAALVAACRDRVAAFLAAGRATAVPDTAAPPHDGPWPPAPQPPGGWVPGEAVSISELVQVMAADPAVLGVSGVRLAVDGGPPLPATPDGAARVPIPAGSVPVLADGDCLRVRLALGAECGDA
ncbi:hypothetical protein, partial [Phytohabitans suffuscus]